MTTAAPDLLAREPRTDTAARILDAAFDCIASVGLGRMTVEDVSRQAGVSRQTIYRYFPSKDHLILALVLREEELFLDGARAAFARNPDLRPALEGAIAYCLRFAREHPLLDRLLVTDPDTLLPFLTTRSAPVLSRARAVLQHEIASKAWVRAGLVDQTVDVLVRTIVSYVLAPADRTVEEVAGDLASIATLALTGKDAVVAASGKGSLR